MQIKKISDEITKEMQDWRNYKEEKKILLQKQIP